MVYLLFLFSFNLFLDGLDLLGRVAGVGLLGRGSHHLGGLVGLLGGKILDAGLTDDEVGIGVRSLPDVRLGDHEKNGLGLLHGNTHDTGNRGQTKLCDGLADFLFRAIDPVNNFKMVKLEHIRLVN